MQLGNEVGESRLARLERGRGREIRKFGGERKGVAEQEMEHGGEAARKSGGGRDGGHSARAAAAMTAWG